MDHPTPIPVQSSRHRAGGFALIEILISLVIFAIGLLGTAGLQVASLQSNQYAAQASVAAGLAREIQNYMESIPDPGTATFYPFDTATYNPGTVVSCFSSTATCTQAQYTAFQLADWDSRVATELPGGRAVVCLDDAPRDTSGAGTGLYHWGCSGTGPIIVKIGWVTRNGNSSQGTDELVKSGDRPRFVIQVSGSQQDFRE